MPEWFRKVPEAPTNPAAASGAPASRAFDVAHLYEDPAGTSAAAPSGTALDERLRQAYFWIVNTAILSPFYDIEYEEGPSQRFTFGDSKGLLTLPSAQSYSSFILLPLLNLAVRRRCLLVGGPGRGKTASAVLMGLLAGYSLKEVRRAIQHGQPQMTVTDLLGHPLPKDLVSAESPEQIRIAWRRWLSMRVKIIDEYNRIPTRTQSALLTVMGDNYAEVYDQVYECPDAAWYLTANDDAGGGTYQVIEALRDRIDVVVKALHFNSRFLGDLLARMEAKMRPEDVVPEAIVFREDELSRMHDEILRVVVPIPIRRRIEFFASQFELCEPAGSQFEYKTKDTLKLSGVDPQSVASRDSGRDRVKDLGSQTKNGLSVRALMTALEFVKAMAYFRGERAVALEDVRQIVPFVLHDKLVPDLNSPFFDVPENEVHRVDRIGWIRRLLDLSCAEYDRLGLDREDPVAELDARLRKGLEGVTESQACVEVAKIERLLKEWSSGRKLYGPLFDDILKLKSMHQRYTNYLRWLRWTAK
ncbi:MAG: AAA family ATPase [Planctomycetes bacterium]|nr:AAA family ATPase [Planctomycetota bacterium]